MAHGDKRWITAYDGTIKRSNDRTRKDYYRDLRWWEPMEGGWAPRGERVFCPQCRHVHKDIVREQRERQEVYRALREEFEALYGEASQAWREYRVGVWKETHDGTFVNTVKRPATDEPPRYHEWMRERTKDLPVPWQYDARSYLCWKCERKYEVKERSWRMPYPGNKDRYGWTVRQNYRDYRAAVRNLMNRARHDEDAYDDIPPYVHGWLD